MVSKTLSERALFGETDTGLASNMDSRRSRRNSQCFEDLETLWTLKWQGETSSTLLHPEGCHSPSAAGSKILQVFGLKKWEDSGVFKPGPCKEFEDWGIPKYPSDWYWNV